MSFDQADDLGEGFPLSDFLDDLEIGMPAAEVEPQLVARECAKEGTHAQQIRAEIALMGQKSRNDDDGFALKERQNGDGEQAVIG